MNNDLKKLEIEIYEILKNFGIKMNLRGYEFISSAIFRIIFNHRNYIKNFCMIYFDLAKEYNTTHMSTERAIRYAIKSIDFNSNKELFEEYFGKSVMKNNSITSSRFIFGIAQKLMLKYK